MIITKNVLLTSRVFSVTPLGDWESEVYLQWQGCPQGLAPAAPVSNVNLAHGVNTALKELWRKMWILYTYAFDGRVIRARGGNTARVQCGAEEAWEEGVIQVRQISKEE